MWRSACARRLAATAVRALLRMQFALSMARAQPVSLMAKARDGRHVPYFKTGGWRFTDGGLQADLPKERLTELFNVNQFIVSQVTQCSDATASPSLGTPT